MPLNVTSISEVAKDAKMSYGGLEFHLAENVSEKKTHGRHKLAPMAYGTFPVVQFYDKTIDSAELRYLRQGHILQSTCRLRAY